MPTSTTMTRRAFAASMLGTVAACSAPIPSSNPVGFNEVGAKPTVANQPTQQALGIYGPITDEGYSLPAIPARFTQGVNRRMIGRYTGEAGAGTIDVDPYAKFLYLVKGDGTAVRYPVGVGRQGRSINGGATIRLKKMWPGWTPTRNMLRTEPEIYGPFRRGIPGGLRSPLGARALYLYRGGRDTFYRIHGTNDLDSIGNSGSAGCIRMFNHDIIDLFNQVTIPMRVNIRSSAESLRVDPEYFGRGVELPARRVDPDDIYGAEAIANDQRAVPQEDTVEM